MSGELLRGSMCPVERVRFAVPNAIVFDEHRTRPGEVSGLIGLSDMSQVNQAIGILIERGHTPEHARAGLDRIAGLVGITVRGAAQPVHATTQ